MLDLGLVTRVVPDHELRDTVQAFTDKLADKSPAVLRRMKAVANRAMNVDASAARAEEMQQLRAHMRSWDIVEGLAEVDATRKTTKRGYGARREGHSGKHIALAQAGGSTGKLGQRPKKQKS